MHRRVYSISYFHQVSFGGQSIVV